jgi:hypothetical protein
VAAVVEEAVEVEEAEVDHPHYARKCHRKDSGHLLHHHAKRMRSSL